MLTAIDVKISWLGWRRLEIRFRLKPYIDFQIIFEGEEIFYYKFYDKKAGENHLKWVLAAYGLVDKRYSIQDYINNDNDTPF